LLTDEQIAARAETAFLPLRCVAEIRDGRKLRFTVFNSKDKRILSMRTVVLSDVRDENHLAQVLQIARSRIRAKGFVLK
jgi:hypothetical protein